MPGRIDMRAIFLNVLERRAALSAWPTRSGDAPEPLCSALVVSGVAREGLHCTPTSISSTHCTGSGSTESGRSRARAKRHREMVTQFSFSRVYT